MSTEANDPGISNARHSHLHSATFDRSLAVTDVCYRCSHHQLSHHHCTEIFASLCIENKIEIFLSYSLFYVISLAFANLHQIFYMKI